MSSGDAEVPTATRAGNTFTYTWPSLNCRMVLSRVRDHGQDIAAEVLVETLDNRHVYLSRLFLLAGESRLRVVKELRGRWALDWAILLEQVAVRTVQAWRVKPDLAKLVPHPPQQHPFCLAPILPVKQISVLYGDGGIGKSVLALALGLSLTSGMAVVPGCTPDLPGAVLYCDWETDQEIHETRLEALMRSSELLEPGPLYYRRMEEDIATAVDGILEDIATHQIALVVVDSFAYACGADPESAEASMRLFRAIRQLGAVTTLVIAHVSHAVQGRPEETGRPFGSIFNRNSPRMTWELRQSSLPRPDGAAVLALYNTKYNAGRRYEPIGLEMAWADRWVQYRATAVSPESDLAAPLPLDQRVIACLRGRNEPETAEFIADAISANRDSVYRVCKRLEAGGYLVSNSDTNSDASENPSELKRRGGRQKIAWRVRSSNSDAHPNWWSDTTHS